MPKISFQNTAIDARRCPMRPSCERGNFSLSFPAGGEFVGKTRTKDRWLPRRGQPLMGKTFPGKLESFANSRFSRVPKMFRHPLVAILLGAAITFAGQGELRVRSYGLLFIATWLIVDFWAWLLPKETRFKFAVGWTVTNLLLIGLMGILWWWLNNALTDKRENVFQNLTVATYIPPGADPLRSVFTIKNGGKYSITPKSELLCLINLAVGNHGTISRGWQENNFHAFVKSGAVGISPLGPGGDARSEQCLAPLSWQEGETDCLDVLLIFQYSLDDQPTLKQEKRFRYVVYKGSDWIPEPIGSNEKFCSQFIKH